MSYSDFRCKKIRHYIYGTYFTVVTDRSLLRWLQQIKEPEGRLAWLALRLQEYNFTIISRAGSQHQKADELSQKPKLALHHAELDRFYKLLGHPEWESDTEETPVP